MRITRIFLILVAVFMAACLGLFDDPVSGGTTDESTGVLTGKVVSESGDPVAGITARLLVLNKEAVTGDDGVFSLKVPLKKPAAGLSKKTAITVDTLVLSYKEQPFYLKPLISLVAELGTLTMASKEIQGNIQHFKADGVERLVAEFNPAEPADKIHANIQLQFDPQTGDFSGTVYYHYTSDTQAYILSITAYAKGGHIAFSNYMLTFRHDTQPGQKGEVKYPENPGVCDTCQTDSIPVNPTEPNENPAFSPVNYFNPEDNATVPSKLSLTGIYAGKSITPEAVQYEVNVPQWTDSIPSFRYLLVKTPGKILFGDTVDHYGYPDGVIFVRTLYIDTIKGNPASRKLFETRLLVKSPGKDEWFPLNYVWNKEQTDAVYTGEEPMGVTYTITTAAGVQNHRWSHDDIFSCRTCHLGRGVNGFLTAQLNRPSPGNPLENQIEYLFNKGVFSGAAPTSYAALPKWAPPTEGTASMDVRMHSYVAAQCSQCHGTRGEVEGQDMNFDYHAMIDYSYVKTPPPAGFKPLVGLDSIIGRYTNILVPGCDTHFQNAKMVYEGDPEASSLYYRMTQRNEDPADFFPIADQMPPSTSFMTDTDALMMVYKWICDMDPVMCAINAGQKKPGSNWTKCDDIAVDNPSGGTPGFNILE